MKKKIRGIIVIAIISLLLITLIGTVKAELTSLGIVATQNASGKYEMNLTEKTTTNARDTGMQGWSGMTVTYLTGGGINHSDTAPEFCVQHGAALPSAEDAINRINGASYVHVDQGTIVYLGDDPGVSEGTTVNTRGYATYNKITNEIAGRGNTYALAYVLKYFEENTDPKGEIQQAVWAILGQGADNDLSKEARSL